MDGNGVYKIDPAAPKLQVFQKTGENDFSRTICVTSQSDGTPVGLFVGGNAVGKDDVGTFIDKINTRQALLTGDTAMTTTMLR